ncbi:hypothetical protein C8P66_111171 [Humitalea rosea]|uniref:Uncharacterized protein n=1 Tax=Humitalea rosea TaxID=990373 RepID=A0A2W7J411_9PROT|nr:hypothetical protein [Humitalea rosea]PZW45755.1 hypothetical protein C8P66_111171 [Humitalea rosea]
MSYIIWVLVLLAALAVIPALNPAKFEGLPIWLVIALGIAALCTMGKGKGVDS